MKRKVIRRDYVTQRMVIVLLLTFLSSITTCHCFIILVKNCNIKKSCTRKFSTLSALYQQGSPNSRRDVFQSILSNTGAALNIVPILIATRTQDAMAYTPDSDQLREALYMISRVQEASVQQERLVLRTQQQEILKRRMKLSLRLVEKSYRIVDQISYCSKFVDAEDLVAASEAGLEGADALQSAIDFVDNELSTGNLTDAQKEILIGSLRETREKLFEFLAFVPSEKLAEARKRVEEENALNLEEFAGDSDASIFNPVKLPWKN